MLAGILTGVVLLVGAVSLGWAITARGGDEPSTEPYKTGSGRQLAPPTPAVPTASVGNLATLSQDLTTAAGPQTAQLAVALIDAFNRADVEAIMAKVAWVETPCLVQTGRVGGAPFCDDEGLAPGTPIRVIPMTGVKDSLTAEHRMRAAFVQLLEGNPAQVALAGAADGVIQLSFVFQPRSLSIEPFHLAAEPWATATIELRSGSSPAIVRIQPGWDGQPLNLWRTRHGSLNGLIFVSPDQAHERR